MVLGLVRRLRHVGLLVRRRVPTHSSASTIWFALALTFGFPGVDTFGGVGAFRVPGAAGALFAEGPQGSERGSGPGPGSSGDSSGDDSSTSSSSRASSSSAASSGSAGSSPAVPFFDPVIPPAGTPSGWQQPRYAP
ncbi:hypothetical protein PF008_g32136 [Phytophthora fragariae]|uniref:Uncharacterized protein n=1 Tax=Phytophthora fragariae TaxID=53985 RepID=A0A6G0Q0S3_9STRA|nr:hypothetical protein PF008_g32136 [Phytophthora fragariae]